MNPSRSFARTVVLAMAAAVILAPGALASEASRGRSTTVILVRHAEKDTVQVGDVPLSEAGQRRARQAERAWEVTVSTGGRP